MTWTLNPNDCLVIGEVAQAHDGSLGAAHAYIDAIAGAGAGAVKFQTHIAEAEGTLAEPWRIRFSKQDETRRDYWKRTAFTTEQWAGLKQHADERGLLFLSSPFSMEAAEMLRGLGMEAWKIASGELNNGPLFDYVLSTRLPVLLSSGMSDLAELDRAVGAVKAGGVPLAVMQCTSAYPCPPEKLGLNLLDTFRTRYGCPVGLSDHSGNIFAGLAAATLGANVVEVHVTFSRDCFGPDVPASVTVTQLRELTDGVRFIRTALNHPREKDELAQQAAPLRAIFTKSVVARRALPAGHVLSADDLNVKKPGTGIPAQRFVEIVGRVLALPVVPDQLLAESDLAE
jgi:N-acetylneuraminate synthase